MSEEKKPDEAGRIRTPMSPATWVADEAPDPEPEPAPDPPKKTTTKKASE